MQFFFDIYKGFIRVLTNHTALAFSLLTAFTFVAGHFSAFAYFSAWGIPYFKLTDNYTGFIFALQNPARVIMFSIFSLSVFLLLFVMKDVAFDKNLRAPQKIFYFLIVTPACYFLMTLSFDSSRYLISGEDDFSLVKKNFYYPFKIVIDDRDLNCVHLIGEIGRYTAIYLKPSAHVELVKTDDIVFILPLMSHLKIDLPLKDVKNNSDSPKVKAWLAYHDKACNKQDSSELIKLNTGEVGS